jgi:hypothetical protein
MKGIYMAHPLGAGPDRELNRARASKWAAWIARHGNAVIADWIILSGEWAETPENRELGLAIDLELVERADELWLVGGRVSAGMELEAARARRLGKTVRDFTHWGETPPEDVR